VRACAGAAAGLLITLALAACGTGGSKASSNATTSPPPAATGTGTAGTGTGTSGAGTATDTTGPATTTAASSTQGHGRKGHKGDGLSPAPGGLAQTTGYGTYERCQGTCTGAVPAALRRPLKLPSDDGGPCPITVSAHPVSPRELPAGVGFHRVSSSRWSIAEVMWTVPGSYAGPLLIRGGMLGGGTLGFGTGTVPYDELQLLDAGQGTPRVAGGGRAWITYTRVRSAGCYAYQIDGTDFSEIVVFRAVV
jgi:hypothetical protein